MRKLSPTELGTYFRDGQLLIKEVHTDGEVELIEAQMHPNPDSLQFYRENRDLHAKSKEVGKAFFPRDFNAIAAELTKEPVLRIAVSQGYDFIDGYVDYKDLWASFSDLFSVGPILLGAILHLDDGEQHKRGDMTLLSPRKRFPLDDLKGKKMLLAYGGLNLLYLDHALDPCVHDRKLEGVNFRDNISAEKNPVVFSK